MLEHLNTRRQNAGNSPVQRSCKINTVQWFLFPVILMAAWMMWIGTVASVVSRRQSQEYQALSAFLLDSIAASTSNRTKSLSLVSSEITFAKTSISSISSRDDNGLNSLRIPESPEQQNRSQSQKGSSSIKFYILEVPQWTTDFFDSSSQFGSSHDNILQFYGSSLNEHSGEMWLHRGFEQLTNEQGRARDPKEADVILIPAYLHYWKRRHLSDFVTTLLTKSDGNEKVQEKKKRKKLNIGKEKVQQKMKRKKLNKKRRKLTELDQPSSNPLEHSTMEDLPDISKTILKLIHFPDKPHVLLIPTVNPVESHKIMLFNLVSKLKKAKVNLFSLAYERNKFWQNMEPSRAIPIPYVVRLEPDHKQRERDYLDETSSPRISNFVFYSGNARKMSEAWGGCNRKMITPLRNRTDMHVKLVPQKYRLKQEEYMEFMHKTAEYCLILCGDTVSSRSLASSIVANCIPIRVGSRLRGFCEPPCRKGWGWTITNGLSHLPYSDSVPWELFPEVDEADFAADPYGTLVKQVFERYDEQKKKQLRYIMRQIRPGFVYGYGNPANSSDFGGAVPYIWKSIVHHLNLTDKE